MKTKENRNSDPVELPIAWPGVVHPTPAEPGRSASSESKTDVTEGQMPKGLCIWEVHTNQAEDASSKASNPLVDKGKKSGNIDHLKYGAFPKLERTWIFNRPNFGLPRPQSVAMQNEPASIETGSRQFSDPVRVTGFPQFWDLFQFFLPASIRNSAYEPSYNELLEDYVIARRSKSSGAIRWLSFCFTIRAGFMVFMCLRIWSVSKLIRPFTSLIETCRHKV